MKDPTTDKFSAGEQGLGYLYQSRLALLRLLELPENTAVFLKDLGHPPFRWVPTMPATALRLEPF